MRVRSACLISTTLMTLAHSQTPPGTLPSTNKSLSVTYATTRVTPGIMLPLNLPATFPALSFPSSSNQTYQLLLLDLSIPNGALNTSALVPGIQVPLTAGISPGRTTRLHYWQTGITFSTNGTLVNTASPIAFYQPPAPPAGDIAHTYVFYLFEQENGFAPPPAGNPFSEALVNEGNNRISFNLNHLAGESGVGPLVGANYFLVKNTTGTAQATGTGTGSVPKPTVVSFLGGAVRSSSGLAGVVLTAVVIVSAILFY